MLPNAPLFAWTPDVQFVATWACVALAGLFLTYRAWRLARGGSGSCGGCRSCGKQKSVAGNGDGNSLPLVSLDTTLANRTRR